MNHDKVKDGAQGQDEFNDLREELRRALPPLGQQELRRDLWPDMLQRLEWPQFRVPWFDWALLGVASAVAIFFPALIPALLYHL